MLSTFRFGVMVSLALCAGLADAAAAPAFGTGLASLPEAVREWAHPTTSRLPAFPGESSMSLDPAKWPRESRDSTRLCTLELRTYDRGRPVTLSSLRQRKPGQSLSARYLCMSRGWRQPRHSGPFYVWDPANTLVERSYRTTDGSRYREDLYQYRGNGLVWAFHHRERNEDQSGPKFFVSEYYDPSGKLAGFSFERDSDSLYVYWVHGARVDERALRAWAASFPVK